MESIIEKELYRSVLYLELIRKITSFLYFEGVSKELKVKILLFRYLVNKIKYRTKDDDPVFICSESQLSKKQIGLDYKFFKISTKTCNKLINLIESNLRESSIKILNYDHKSDQSVKRIKIKNKYYLLYRDIKLYDIRNYGLINAQYAFALQIRYNYLFTSKKGINVSYEDYNLNPQQCGEAFMNVFNHYFDEYCSLFPDLEMAFGSKGSFFDFNNWQKDIIFIVPPHDQILIETIIDTILEYVENNKNKTFILQVPFWIDMEKLHYLKMHPYCKGYSLFVKGELKCIDHIKKFKCDYPCDILTFMIKH